MFSRFPFWLYNTALIAGAPLWLGYYGLRRRQRRLRLRERCTYPLLPHAAPRIWLHSVSVGEVLAGQPLAGALRERFPQSSLVISTTTDTGQARAREQLAWMDAHFYFPLDVPWLTERAVTSLQPALVIILETEIWPNFLRTCARHHVPVVLANGRLSDRSFAHYRWLGRMMGDLLGHFQLCLMQSDADAERIRQLGAPPARVLTTGNLKYAPPDADERARRDRIATALQQQYHLRDGRLCIVAGSTVEGEEPLLVEVFARLRASADLPPAGCCWLHDIPNVLRKSPAIWSASTGRWRGAPNHGRKMSRRKSSCSIRWANWQRPTAGRMWPLWVEASCHAVVTTFWNRLRKDGPS